MTITFKQLTGGETIAESGQGQMTLLAGARGFDRAPDAGSAVGVARLLLRSNGSVQGYGSVVPPAVPAQGVAMLALGSAGSGNAHSLGAGGARIGIGTRGYDQASAGGTSRITVAGLGTEDSFPAGHAVLVCRPPLISAFGGLAFVNVADGVGVQHGQRSQPTSVLAEAIGSTSSARNRASAAARASAGMAFTDELAIVYLAILEEGITFDGAVQLDRASVEHVIERLVLSRRADSYGEALNQVIAGLVMMALEQKMALESVAVGVSWSPVIADLHSSIERMLDRALWTDEGTAGGHGVMLVQESVATTDAAVTAAALLSSIQEGVAFAAHLSLDSGEYLAYVLNTESRGLSRYTNYPFNSFARVGGRYVAAAADGLHTLDGDDDDGQPIKARIRAGLSGLGTRRLKRAPEAFIGYSSDGVLLLHVIVVNEQTGAKEAAIYRLQPRAAGATRESRWKMGRGIKAVDFDFIVENVDGADFDIQAIEFRPVFLDRRTRG